MVMNLKHKKRILNYTKKILKKLCKLKSKKYKRRCRYRETDYKIFECGTDNKTGAQKLFKENRIINFCKNYHLFCLNQK